MSDPERPLCEADGCTRRAVIVVKGRLLCARCYLKRYRL